MSFYSKPNSVILKLMHTTEIKVLCKALAPQAGTVQCPFSRRNLLSLQDSPKSWGNALAGDTWSFPWHWQENCGWALPQDLLLNPAADLFCLYFFPTLSLIFPFPFCRTAVITACPLICGCNFKKMSLCFLAVPKARVPCTSENKERILLRVLFIN